MRTYEILLILPAEADDAVVGGVTDRVTGVIGGSGGQISKVDRWGRRRLSYEIDHATEGYYLLAEFVADPGDVKELDRVMTLADDVIRFKVVVLPEKRGRGWGREHTDGRSTPSEAPRPEAVAEAPATAPTEAPEPSVDAVAEAEEDVAPADEEVAPAEVEPADDAAADDAVGDDEA
jgi:small subunit ribosomal protein S6